MGDHVTCKVVFTFHVLCHPDESDLQLRQCYDPPGCVRVMLRHWMCIVVLHIQHYRIHYRMLWRDACCSPLILTKLVLTYAIAPVQGRRVE